MIKAGITGQAGFIGKHLYNTLGLFPDEFERVEFERAYFNDDKKLNEFVEHCDVIIHLAAMNRHSDQQVIYDTNIQLVEKLVAALRATKSKAHVIFSSSTQEERDNLYGKSKKEGRDLMVQWAKEYGGKFSGLIIPNVFGPFGLPDYNSVVATFCYKLTHEETPRIDVDGNMQLIYVGELVKEIVKEIRAGKSNYELKVTHTAECKVSRDISVIGELSGGIYGKGDYSGIEQPL